MGHEETGERVGVVVVGVDDSPGARLALREAVRTAIRRHDRLRVVTAYDPPPPHRVGEAPGVPYGNWPPVPGPSRAAVERAVLRRTRRSVDDALAEAAARGADRRALDVEVEAVPGHPVAVLVTAARGADELVIGHRGRGALASTALGSVGLGCVLNAGCPVTVVPRPAQPSAVA